MTPQAKGGENEVAEVAHFQDVEAQVRKDSEQVFPPLADAVVTPVFGPADQLAEARRELHLGVDESEEGIQIALVERVVHEVAALHVLLRHRPRSIPRLREGAHAQA